jgi:toxin HigB-1
LTKLPNRVTLPSVIESFSCKETEKIFRGERSRRIPLDVQSRAFTRLRQIHQSDKTDQLRTPAGNRLELLGGDLNGYWSIRINQQWRIVFQWENGNASEVRIVDYH